MVIYGTEKTSSEDAALPLQMWSPPGYVGRHDVDAAGKSKRRGLLRRMKFGVEDTMNVQSYHRS